MQLPEKHSKIKVPHCRSIRLLARNIDRHRQRTPSVAHRRPHAAGIPKPVNLKPDGLHAPLTERLNKKVERHADVVGDFPNEASMMRLIGAVLFEQNVEWQTSSRYIMAKAFAQNNKGDRPRAQHTHKTV